MPTGNRFFDYDNDNDNDSIGFLLIVSDSLLGIRGEIQYVAIAKKEIRLGPVACTAAEHR